MARPPSYKTVEISTASQVIFGTERINVKPKYIIANVKKQSHGGAIIVISQDFADYQAIVFITDKKVKK